MSSGNGTSVPAVREAHPAPAPQQPLDGQIAFSLIVHGDLSKLSPAQKVDYYNYRCRIAKLDPATKPFDYLTLSGKHVLYANKSATDGLTSVHGISVEIVAQERDAALGIAIVHARAIFPSGRRVDDTGCVSIKGLMAEPLCNALMKAATKAKRRAVLSACGLGDVIDESELDTIPPDRDHLAEGLNNNTGHGRTGAYADRATTDAYIRWRDEFLQVVNGKWLDRWTGRDGEIPAGVKELCSTWQFSGHLVKWARAEGRIQAPPDDRTRTRQYDPLAAIVFGEDFPALKAEARRYTWQLWQEAESKLAPPEPEDESQEPRGRETGEADGDDSYADGGWVTDEDEAGTRG